MKNLPPMRALAAVLFALFLTALASVHGAQSVVTSIKYNGLPILGNVPACYKPLTIQLTITDMAAAGCSITFQGVAGSVVSQPTAYGGIIDATKVQVTPDNSLVPPRLTVANISGSTLTGTGTIEFEVALTGCELFPFESTATPPPITFLTTSPCGTVLNAAPVDVDVPIIQLVKNPVPYSSHDNEPFLMNEVVKRYYKVEATRGVVDFFTLDLTPEPHITITAMRKSTTRFCCWVSQPARQTTRRLKLGKFTARFALEEDDTQSENPANCPHSHVVCPRLNFGTLELGHAAYEDDVRGLDVAMHQSVRVQVRPRRGEGQANFDAFGGREAGFTVMSGH